MNDFEKIYSVIKTKYLCGEPYYEYGNCYYNDIIQNYIQEGILNLNKSVGYQNITVNDIPAGCSQPVNAIITCSPTIQQVEKPDPGFRLNFNNSSYLYPNNEGTGLVLRNPANFNLLNGEEGYKNNLNSLFLFEKSSSYNCLKHINTKKYASYDNNSNSFLLTDTCNNVNNVVYKDNNLIYNSSCINPNGIFTTVPDGNIPSLSACNKITNIKMELIDEPILSFGNIEKINNISDILNSIPVSTIPTTFSIFKDLNIPSKYYTTLPLGLTNTKIKYSKNITLILTNNIIYITRNEGINWNILSSNVKIFGTTLTQNIVFNTDEQDIDMSEDGKYIMISDKINFYVSSDYGYNFTSFITDITQYMSGQVIVFYKKISTNKHNVCMSRDGKVQISYIGEIVLSNNQSQYSIYNISYDYGQTFQRKYIDMFNNPDITSFNNQDHENSNYINNILMTYDGSLVLLLKNIKNDTSKKLEIVYLYNQYEKIASDNLLIPINSKISIDSKNIYMLYDTYLQYSNDYGKTWIQYNFLTTGTFRNKINISKTGKYVYLLISTINSSKLIYSSNYGNTFNNFQTNDINLNNITRYFYNFDLTDDGTKLILADNTKIYFINTNETPDEYIINRNELIITPEDDFKYLYKSFIKENNLKIIKIIKNGRDIFALINEITISYKLINVILFNEKQYNSFYIPNIDTVSNICISNDMFYTKGNKIYNYSHKEIFSANKDIIYMTTNKIGKLYLALSDKIHISKDSINWNTINLEPRKWIMGCISEEFNVNNNYSITIIEEFGNIFISLDSGVNWKSSNNLKPNYWNSISMSNNGIVQLCTCKKDIPFVSYDYGVSWESIDFKYDLLDTQEFVDCCVSENGNIMLSIVNNGNILICHDKKWRIYGEYEYNRTEINIDDNHYKIYTSLYNLQIDPFTFYYNNSSTIYQQLFYSFKQYYKMSPRFFQVILPYNNNFNYLGNSKTYDVDKKIYIYAEYIEIQFDKNVFFNLNKVYIGSNKSNSNRDTNIKNLRIMGSNDGSNYKELINITDNSTFFNILELIYIVKTDLYFNNYRIVLDNIKTQGVSFLNGLNFEGKTKINCNDIIINSWRNVIIKNDYLMLSSNDSFYLGNKTNLIFSNYMLIDTIDIIISNNTTLTTDLYCKTLTINKDIILNTNSFRIFCIEKLINYGIIQNIGETPSRGSYLGGLGGGSSIGTLGNGGNSGIYGTSTLNCVISANGGNGTYTLGGTANVISDYNIICEPYYAILGKDSKGNLIGGGGGGGGGASGGGGGGGGIIMICAKVINLEPGSKINASGGDGSYTNTIIRDGKTIYEGGGGGGGGGTVIIVTTSYTMIKDGFINVNGGRGNQIPLNKENSSNGLTGRIVIVRV